MFSRDWVVLLQVGTCGIWSACRSAAFASELDRLRIQRWKFGGEGRTHRSAAHLSGSEKSPLQKVWRLNHLVK